MSLRKKIRGISILISFCFFLLASSAFGLNPSRPLDEFARRVWSPRDGLPQNSVQAVQQTPDGYLWFGTQEGLARFDGTQFTIYSKTTSPAFKTNNVTALRSAEDGSLWIGIRGGGVVHYQNGDFHAYRVADFF